MSEVINQIRSVFLPIAVIAVVLAIMKMTGLQLFSIRASALDLLALAIAAGIVSK